MKTCKIHGELSQENIKSGVYRNKKYAKCRLCENERARVYTKKIYADPELVKKKHERNRQRWKDLKAEITAQRQTPEALEKRRLAYARLAPRYRDKCREKQQAYRDELADSYIRRVIQNGDKNLKFDSIPAGMIELKRSIMKLRRGISNKHKSNMGDRINENQECGTVEEFRDRCDGKTRKRKD